jgi:hypothetical protein
MLETNRKGDTTSNYPRGVGIIDLTRGERLDLVIPTKGSNLESLNPNKVHPIINYNKKEQFG